jgi:hypothetical protein
MWLSLGNGRRMKWSQIGNNRKQIPGYPEGAY